LKVPIEQQTTDSVRTTGCRKKNSLQFIGRQKSINQSINRAMDAVTFRRQRVIGFLRRNFMSLPKMLPVIIVNGLMSYFTQLAEYYLIKTVYSLAAKCTGVDPVSRNSGGAI
jgi:hypothetical protein